MAPSSTDSTFRRTGFSYRRLIAAIGVLLMVLFLTWMFWPGFSFSAQDTAPILHTAERSDFIHEITESGNVESGNNIEIRCEVEAKGAAGTTILEIVSEGSSVKKGQVVVKLDSSALEKELVNEQIGCSNSMATLIQAENVLETAKIAKREYLEGKYLLEKQAIENEIIVAEENHRRAVDYLEYSERLAAKGYVTALQLEADRFSVEKALNTLDSANTKLRVLEEFSKEKQVKQLEADIQTAEASFNAKQASYKLDLEQLALVEEQVQKCIIHSPEDGQVVYGNVTRRHGTDTVIDEGEKVRENQVVIRLPDPSDMQVDVKISEAKVTLVEKGMPVTIHLDAFPDMELTGWVDTVNELPEPAGWFTTGAKEYGTIVKIENPPPGLRPGLTAQIKIHVEQLSDVLQVPTQAIFEHGGKYYCITEEKQGLELHEVQIGSTNDQFVVIRGGIQEGQQVVLNATAYRDKVDLPELTEPAAKPLRKKRKPSPTVTTGPPTEQAPAAASPSPPNAAPKPAGGGGDRFATLDTNGDGRLEGSEIPEQMKPHLSALDGNGDGAIDQAEMQAAVQRMRDRGGPPGQDGPGGPRPEGQRPPRPGGVP